MRRILFRGKNLFGKWIEGDLIQYLIYGKMHIARNSWGAGGQEVDPETVGQYTGLTDMNGNKIFEGDIVKCRDIYNDIEFTAVVEFGNPNRAYNWGWQLRIIDGDEYINPDILLWVDMEDTGAICEVIGTVHDNPEHLERGISI